MLKNSEDMTFVLSVVGEGVWCRVIVVVLKLVPPPRKTIECKTALNFVEFHSHLCTRRLESSAGEERGVLWKKQNLFSR